MTAIGALVFTGLSLISTRDQVSIAEQGQVTDRYTKAVEQIGQKGDDHLQVRLGGIYALERLARDSPRDQPTIIEILSAFIRTTNPTKATGACPQRQPAPDIQAALNVLTRRNPDDDNAIIDLADTCLFGVQPKGPISIAPLPAGANLRGAILSGADLTGAYLLHADLTHAFLINTSLRSASLFGADLSNASASGSDLRNAGLTGANLNGTSLGGADLRGAWLSDARHDDQTSVIGAKRDSFTRDAWW